MRPRSYIGARDPGAGRPEGMSDAGWAAVQEGEGTTPGGRNEGAGEAAAWGRGLLGDFMKGGTDFLKDLIKEGKGTGKKAVEEISDAVTKPKKDRPGRGSTRPPARPGRPGPEREDIGPKSKPGVSPRRGGPWARPVNWTTDTLRVIAAKVVRSGRKGTGGSRGIEAAREMLASLKDAKAGLEILQSRSADPTTVNRTGRLQARWFDAASGLLLGAKAGGDYVSLGRRDVNGIGITRFGRAFALMGGADYARALNDDVQALVRMRSPTAGGGVMMAGLFVGVGFVGWQMMKKS